MWLLSGDMSSTISRAMTPTERKAFQHAVDEVEPLADTDQAPLAAVVDERVDIMAA